MGAGMRSAALAEDAALPLGRGTVLDRHGALGEDIALGEIKFLTRKQSNHYMLPSSAQTRPHLEPFFNDKGPQAAMPGLAKTAARPLKTHSVRNFLAFHLGRPMGWLTDP